MNKTMINVLLFLTLVMGTMAILTFDVWADESEVYEIPESYNSENYSVSFYSKKTSDTYYNSDIYNYDFTIYYPSDYKSTLYVKYLSEYRTHNYYYYLFSIRIFNETQNYIFNLGELIFDKNGIAKLSVSDLCIYIVQNDCTRTITNKALKKENIDNNKCTISNIDMNGLAKFQYDWTYGSPYSMTINNYFLYASNDKTVYLKYKNLENENNKNTYSDWDKEETKLKAYKELFDKKNNQSNDFFPEPTLKSAKLNDDETFIRLVYSYDHDSSLMSVETYSKIYVKLQGKEEWEIFDNLEIISVNYDSDFKVVAGGVNLDKLYNILGYDEFDDTSVKPIVQAVIWGVRYKYLADENKYKYGYVNTGYVMNRYIFENAIIDNPDIKIDDLGNLTDIKPGSSGSDVTVKPGGSANNPTISATDEVDYSDVGSFFKSLNFDFSSIGKALSGSFSLVTGFASMIGSIFQNLFGDAVGIIALLAIGICIVLRVLGR